MAVTMTGLAIAAMVAGTAYGGSEAHKAGTSAEHGRERAAGRTQELKDKAKKEQSALALASKEEKQKLAAGVGRNTTMFTSPLGVAGQAQIARKTLTGE